MFCRSFLALSLAAVAVAADPVVVTVPGAEAAPAVTVAPAGGMTLQQKASYLFGQQIARAVKQFDLDDTALLQSIADAKAGKPSAVPESEMQQVMQAWQQEIQGREAKKGEARKETNKAWLADNAKKDGVKVTASGLQYKVIASGKGKQPAATDQVSVNYTGSLTDGTVFDASEKHGGPATFGVNQVIKGWTEALQMMHEGDKWELYIPAELAYGDQAPPNIGPNQVLVFQVELLKIGAAAPAQQ
jgi:FKBP-type peptidyl-prolyl cis-trans isomerase